MTKGKTTGHKAASNASKTLTNESTGSQSKSSAGSALSQANAPNKTTSKAAAHSASKVVSDGRTNKASRSAAGSALSQKEDTKGSKGGSKKTSANKS